jgi:hypothetical protein
VLPRVKEMKVFQSIELLQKASTEKRLLDCPDKLLYNPAPQAP